MVLWLLIAVFRQVGFMVVAKNDRTAMWPATRLAGCASSLLLAGNVLLLWSNDEPEPLKLRHAPLGLPLEGSLLVAAAMLAYSAIFTHGVRHRIAEACGKLHARHVPAAAATPAAAIE